MDQFRVLDAVDDLVDDLVSTARRTLVDLDEQLARLTATRASIVAFVATVATPAVTVKEAKPIASVKTVTGRAAPSLVSCPECGYECTPQKLWRHRKLHAAPVAEAS